MEGARHFAVALGAGAFKLPTVADLVRAIADAASHAHHATARASTRRGSAPSSSSSIPMAVLCGSRDAVDDVAAACSKLGVIRALHADQDGDERKGVLVACARSTWRAGSDDDDEEDGEEEFDTREPSDAVRCVCMVTTDACLPSAASGEASLGFPLLVNYDVPRTKEAYARRARVALAPPPSQSLPSAGTHMSLSRWSSSALSRDCTAASSRLSASRSGARRSVATARSC